MSGSHPIGPTVGGMPVKYVTPLSMKTLDARLSEVELHLRALSDQVANPPQAELVAVADGQVHITMPPATYLEMAQIGEVPAAVSSNVARTDSRSMMSKAAQSWKAVAGFLIPLLIVLGQGYLNGDYLSAKDAVNALVTAVVTALGVYSVKNAPSSDPTTSTPDL